MSGPVDCELKSLHDAVESKNLDLLESLLKGGSDPNTADKKGRTALNFICSLTKFMKIDLKIIQLLIQFGADVNTQDEDGNSPMMNLFHDESNDMRICIEALELLLKNGADVTRVNHEGRTIFNNIILCNPTNTNIAVALELLLKYDADEFDETALNFICDLPKLTRVHLKMIQILLKYKADVNIQDKNGFSPIMSLFLSPENYKLRLKVFNLLLGNGTDVTLVDIDGDTILHIIFYCSAKNAAKNPCIVEEVELLLERGIDVNVRNENGYSAFHSAVRYCRDIRVIELFLKNDADPNTVDINNGWTALHYICSPHQLTRFHLKLTQLLIQHKADVNIRDKDGFSPIMNLFRGAEDYKLRWKVFKLLLENGADVTLINNEGDTVLHLLFKNNAEENPCIVEAVELLLKSEVDVNVKNNDGYSAIMLLYQILCRDQGHMFKLVKVLELMLKNGADVNIKDNIIYNETILHDAVYCIQPKHVAILLKNGADPNITDVNGKIPLNYIFKNFNKYVEYFLHKEDLKTYLELLKLNVEHNADPCHVGADGKTALHSLIEEISSFANIPKQADWKSVSNYVRQYIEVLLKHGLDVNIKDGDGFTALSLAVSYCNYDTAKILVEHGADVNTVRFEGGFLECRWIESSNLTNFLAIIKFWQSKGFQINNRQYLTVFKFLTLHQDFETNDDFYSWLFEICDSSHYRLALWFRHTYELGSGSLIRKLVEMLIRYDNSTCTNYDSGKIKEILFLAINRYLYLIEYGNMYMDIETYNYLGNKLNLLVSENPEIEEQRTYKDIRDQVDLAKKKIISKNISYLDLCTSSPDKTYYLLQKCDYESAMNSTDFYFDEIGGIIRGYIIKALVRRLIKQSTTDSVKLLFHGILPDLCCDKIIKFLDVIDLVSVYEAVINYKC